MRVYLLKVLNLHGLCFVRFVLVLMALYVAPVRAAVLPNTIVTLSGAPITYSDVVTADFNGDGYKEIVATGSDGMIYVASSTDGVAWSVEWSHQCNDDIKVAASTAPFPPDIPGLEHSAIYPIDPKSTNAIEASPAVADLDNDGHLDIIVAMGGNIHKEDWNERGNGGILVYHYVSSSPWQFQMSGDWPQPKFDRVGDHCPGPNHPTNCGLSGFGYPDGLWDGIMTSPAIGDLDGDGDLEIVVAGIDRRIYAWHHDGVAVDGWPIYRSNGDALLRGGMSSPALGDIDNDGLVEVIVGTMSPPWDPSIPVVDGVNPDYSKGTIWAINGDSSNVPGWPIATEQLINSSPSLGDLDNDGYLEVVVGAGRGTAGRENLVFAFRSDGTTFPGWPVETAATTEASPAIGDIDDDGLPEVVIGCGWNGGYNTCGDGTAKLYAFNSDGSDVQGFPMRPKLATYWVDHTKSRSMPFSPVIADINGDGSLEILITQSQDHGFTVVSSSGNDEGLKQLEGAQGYLESAPLVDDIDNDGMLEIVIAGGANFNPGADTGKIFIWDEIGPADASKMPWPMARGNSMRTGLLERKVFPPGVSPKVKSLSFLKLLLFH